MYNVYKVTAATIKKTPKGYELYNLQLNNELWATKLVPLSARDRKYEQLYKLYTNNNKNLDFLLGKYIAIELESSKFGTNFNYIASFDALNEFKTCLDKSDEKPFFTRINIFEFLDRNGYPINPDGSITLREPYSRFNIRIKDRVTICYLNKREEGTLTPENIKPIYDKFFKDRYIDNGNPDRNEEYAMTPVAIIINVETYHKSKSGVKSSRSFDVLKIGDKLSEEQRQFLSKLHLIKTQ